MLEQVFATEIKTQTLEDITIMSVLSYSGVNNEKYKTFKGRIRTNVKCARGRTNPGIPKASETEAR